MSSTSSSDCESCECSRCTYSFDNNQNDYRQYMTSSRHVPIYATMAQPLIYYAQVQQPQYRRQNSDQPKRENPFKKAFRWYTQERKAVCCGNEAPAERSGFASWLDNKYSEYLRENGQQPNQSWDPNTCQCPKTTKRFKRFQSPWRKRPCPANDSGDVPQKMPDGSCEYILKPKEMSRAASETCYHSPTSAGKSNATIESSHLPCNAKCSRRSQSVSDVRSEKYVNRHVETVPLTVQEGTYISCDCTQQQIVCPPLTQRQQGWDNQQGNIPEAVQVPSKQQDPRNQLEVPCTCPKASAPMKVKSNEQQMSMNQPKLPCTCQIENPPVVVVLTTEPSKQLDASNQPGLTCTCQNEKLPDTIVIELSKEQVSMNQSVPPCKCSQAKAQSKKQDPINQPVPPCKCSQAKVQPKEQISSNQPVPPCKCSQAKVQPKEQVSSNQPVPPCKCSQVKVPIVEKLPSRHEEAPQVVEVQQEKIPEVVKAPSKVQEPTNDRGPCCKCEKEKVPKVVQVPSKDQDPKGLQGSCCSCHRKKVPEVVQVPSQCTAVEESSQCPEQKVVPVCEETQYEPAPTPLRSAQKLGPCCCKICKPARQPAPQPLQQQIFCIPVKVHTNKMSSPNICCTVTPSVQCIPPRKQKKVKQCSVATIASQCGEGMKSKAVSQCQHQTQNDQNEVITQCMPEICLCGKGNPSSHNCCEERQVCGPIPIKRESHSTIALNKETGELSITKEVAVSNKLIRCVTCACASNGAAQTSDHSIRFEKDGACSCPYPLFFKIFYPEEAKNEGCK